MIGKSSVLALGLVGILLFTGCGSKTGTGALAGGALGAGIGGLAGGGQGALIGGAAGVLVGGLVGAGLDDRDQQNLKHENQSTYDHIDQGEQLSVGDIIHLHKAGISDEKTIALIRKTKSHFALNSYQIEQLHNAGVSERVINHMMYNT